MDAVDMELLRRIGIAPFQFWPHETGPAATVPALARALELSEDTVRRRLTALEESGVLAGLEIWPNFRCMSLHASTYHFRAPEPTRKPNAVQQIVAIDGVLDAFEMLGPDICVDVCYRDAADRTDRLARIGELLGGASPSAFFDYPLPPVKRDLSPLDWRILQELRGRPDRPLDDVAGALAVSRRTVKRRLERMRAEGAFDVVGNFNPGALRGFLLTYFLFHLRAGTGRLEARAAVNAFQGRWVAQWSPPESRFGHMVVVTVAASAREIEDFRREAESLGHVERVEALIFHNAEGSPTWVDAEIRRRTGFPAQTPEVPAPRPRT